MLVQFPGGRSLALSNSVGGYADVAQLDYNATTSPYPLTLNLKHSRPFVISGGNVGIGSMTNPAQKLDVSGTIHASNLNGSAIGLSCDGSGNIVRSSSDRRLKKNIKKIRGALNKVMKLRGVTFDWKKEANMGTSSYGLIAQEVEIIIPELVGESADGLKSVNYSNIVAVLVEAIKEQQDQLLSLKKVIDKLNKKK